MTLSHTMLYIPGGKAEAVRRIRLEHGYKCIAVVGDGVTDLEARLHADLMIGYGGNIVQERVKAESDWFVLHFGELSSALLEE